ncbi:MAG: hypothetical protein F6K00_27355 [Leptolyngbya sp. SIOISBB]|nr:hypothetical protein [Leptolyngbya sp. SIOISBB]
MSLSKQEIIVEKIRASFESQDKSKQLLEIAKVGVEKAIETDEVNTTWIQQRLAALGLTLT